MGSFDDIPFLEFDLRQNGLRERIRKAEGNEIGCRILFPVWKTATVANGDLPEAGAGRRRYCRGA